MFDVVLTIPVAQQGTYQEIIVLKQHTEMEMENLFRAFLGLFQGYLIGLQIWENSFTNQQVFLQ